MKLKLHISDNTKLTLKEYRQLIYDEIESNILMGKEDDWEVKLADVHVNVNPNDRSQYEKKVNKDNPNPKT